MVTKEFLQKTDKIPGWLSRREGRLLYYFSSLLGHKGSVVEIGSFAGKSTAFLALALKETGASHVFSIDPHLGQTHADSPRVKSKETFGRFKKNLKNLGLEKRVVILRKTSEEANRGWTKPIAVLNVDGLHEYEFAREDLRLWLPHLIPGGAVICHDAFSPYPEVFAAVREMVFDSGEFRFVGVSESQIFAIKGEPTSLLERINLWRSVFFVTLASSIWHNKQIPAPIADFLVKRVLKVFYLNRFAIFINLYENYL